MCDFANISHIWIYIHIRDYVNDFNQPLEGSVSCRQHLKCRCGSMSAKLLNMHVWNWIVPRFAASNVQIPIVACSLIKFHVSVQDTLARSWISLVKFNFGGSKVCILKCAVVWNKPFVCMFISSTGFTYSNTQGEPEPPALDSTTPSITQLII